jgi:nucleoside-diphosphate-sugar epimerase
MARGLMACALRGEPGEIYNLASGVETTIRELAERINDLTGNATPMWMQTFRKRRRNNVACQITPYWRLQIAI